MAMSTTLARLTVALELIDECYCQCLSGDVLRAEVLAMSASSVSILKMGFLLYVRVILVSPSQTA